MNTKRLIDLASPPYPELLFKALGQDGVFPYHVKCIMFGLMLYILGIPFACMSSTLYPDLERGLISGYLGITNIITPFISIVGGITLWGFFSFLRKVDDTLIQLSFINAPEEKEKFSRFVKWVNSHEGWEFGSTKKEIRLWDKGAFLHYLVGILSVIVGFTYGYYTMHEPSQISMWYHSKWGLSSIWYLLFCSIIALVIAITASMILYAVMIIRNYCEGFISSDKIMPLNPDKTGGLQALGELALNLDVICSVPPGLVIFVYLATGGSLSFITIGFLILYTLWLFMVFFIPLIPAHNVMLEAKKRELRNISNVFKKFHTSVYLKDHMNEKNLKVLRARISHLYFMYNEINKMAVWPIDFKIIIRFIGASVFPLVSSIVVQLSLAYIPRFWG